MKNYNAGAQQGEMLVKVTPTVGGVVKVIAKTVAAGSSLPSDPDGTEVEIPKINGSHKKDPFLVTNLPQNTPFADNKTFLYWGLNASDDVIETGDPVTFAAVPNPSTGIVLGTHCIWLTYADPGITPLVPYGEHTDPGSPYIPFGVRVPDTAKTVRVRVTSATTWGHGPGNSNDSDAGGMDPTVPLTRPDIYRDTPALHAAKIKSETLRFNLLVGLREYKVHDTADTHEIGIGLDATFDVISAISAEIPVRLRLGLHDSYEWSNNNGQVAVEITWAE